ncbi:MAG: hypothetical protein ACR2JQ_11260, partial [Mycobacteriales bacterium]
MTEGLVLPTVPAGRFLLRAFDDGDIALAQEASADPLIPLITTVPIDDSIDAALAFIARQHDRAR